MASLEGADRLIRRDGRVRQTGHFGDVVDHRACRLETVRPEECEHRLPIAAIGRPGPGMSVRTHFGEHGFKKRLTLRFGSGHAPGIADPSVRVEDGIAEHLAVLDGVQLRGRLRIHGSNT